MIPSMATPSFRRKPFFAERDPFSTSLRSSIPRKRRPLDLTSWMPRTPSSWAVQPIWFLSEGVMSGIRLSSFFHLGQQTGRPDMPTVFLKGLLADPRETLDDFLLCCVQSRQYVTGMKEKRGLAEFWIRLCDHRLKPAELALAGFRKKFRELIVRQLLIECESQVMACLLPQYFQRHEGRRKERCGLREARYLRGNLGTR